MEELTKECWLECKNICSHRLWNFTKIYLSHLDNARHQLAAMYNENTEMDWNGTTSKGRNQVLDALYSLPQSIHHVTDFEVETDNPENPVIFDVTVRGLAKFKNIPLQDFEVNFVINNMQLSTD